MWWLITIFSIIGIIIILFSVYLLREVHLWKKEILKFYEYSDAVSEYERSNSKKTYKFRLLQRKIGEINSEYTKFKHTKSIPNTIKLRKMLEKENRWIEDHFHYIPIIEESSSERKYKERVKNINEILKD